MREQNEQMLFFLSMLHAACSMIPCRKPVKSRQQNHDHGRNTKWATLRDPLFRRIRKFRIRKSDGGRAERREDASVYGFQLLPYLALVKVGHAE